MDREMQRMKDKRLPDDLINSKDLQIESLVEFYNDVDGLIQYYKLALANRNTENHFLLEMVAKKISIQDLLEFKPMATRIEIVNQETGESQTISTING
jgi:hypothetical protein